MWGGVGVLYAAVAMHMDMHLDRWTVGPMDPPAQSGFSDPYVVFTCARGEYDKQLFRYDTKVGERVSE